MKKNIKTAISMFLFVFGTATTAAVFITFMIFTLGHGESMIPASEIAYDFAMGAFIASVQLIWLNVENASPITYVRRSIIHFAVLVGGCTLLMYAVGWLPPLGWPIAVFYVSFIALYCAIWAVVWNNMKKRSAEFNAKLREYKEAK